MKKSILKIVYTVIMFLIAMLMIDHFMNKGNTDITAEMPKATYPLVYVMEGDTRINCLHGYDREMDCSQLDDTISPLQKDDRKISLQIDLYADSISTLAYEVRSADGQRLVEDTQAGSFTESEDMAYVDLVLKDLLEENTEYSFCLKLTDTEGRTIYYYTRIVLADAAYHVSDMTAFALDFHSRSFDKDRAQELTKYLESNADGDNTTYSKVTIHSSFAQITWGDLSVKEETEPEVYVRRINPYVANVELRYALSVDMADGCRYYNVTEYYYIRYTAERMYLLDYERDMDSYFEPEAASYTNNKLSLGISDGNLELAESEDGNVFAFVKENRLFSINLTDSKTALLFGFYDQNNMDSRTLYQDGGIRIASVDETGNVRFLVYGYMNRGNHEGSVGVGCYYYNSMLNTIEEEVYIPYTGSSQRLMQDISQLAYVNNKNQLFLILDHVIYQIDLVGKSYTALQENLIQGSYRVSESNRMIAWLTGDVDNSQELILLNLNTGRQTKIEAGSGRCIRPLGFMNEDLIYGLAYRTDITKDTMGNTLFLMYDVKIQNESGDILKDYNKNGIYVLEAQINGNQIDLHRVSADGNGGYTAVADDQIMNDLPETTQKNTVEVVATKDYEKIAQLAMKSSLKSDKMKYLTPKQVMYEGERSIHLPQEEEKQECYYVYDGYRLSAIVQQPREAVSKADALSGKVIDENGNCIWEKSNRSNVNQIMKITADTVSEERSSVAVCIDTILSFEGVSRNSMQLLQAGKSLFDILQENLPDDKVLDLTGCSMESVLYYVGKDIPVMALLNDGNAVLIVGYNELNTVIFNPMSGTISKMGMNDSRDYFEANGNCFITYSK